MNTYKLTYPDSPCIHIFQSGDDLGTFVERTFGSVNAMIKKGVVIDHPDFDALVGKKTAAPEVVVKPKAEKTKKENVDASKVEGTV